MKSRLAFQRNMLSKTAKQQNEKIENKLTSHKHRTVLQNNLLCFFGELISLFLHFTSAQQPIWERAMQYMVCYWLGFLFHPLKCFVINCGLSRFAANLVVFLTVTFAIFPFFPSDGYVRIHLHSQTYSKSTGLCIWVPNSDAPKSDPVELYDSTLFVLSYL